MKLLVGPSLLVERDGWQVCVHALYACFAQDLCGVVWIPSPNYSKVKGDGAWRITNIRYLFPSLFRQPHPSAKKFWPKWLVDELPSLESGDWEDDVWMCDLIHLLQGRKKGKSHLICWLSRACPTSQDHWRNFSLPLFKSNPSLCLQQKRCLASGFFPSFFCSLYFYLVENMFYLQAVSASIQRTVKQVGCMLITWYKSFFF